MMGKTHQLVGITLTASGLLLAGMSPLSAAFPIAMGIGWVASVLPDIDGDPNSGDASVRRILGVGNKQTTRNISQSVKKIVKAKNIGGLMVGLMGLLFALAAKVVAWIINIFALLVGHRGLTHWGITWLGLTAVTVLISFLLYDQFTALMGYSPYMVIALPFSIGYGSHIICDMATRSGIAIWGPLSSKPYHVLPKGLRLRTGSWEEYVFLAAWVGVITPVVLAFIYIIRGGW